MSVLSWDMLWSSMYLPMIVHSQDHSDTRRYDITWHTAVKISRENKFSFISGYKTSQQCNLGETLTIVGISPRLLAFLTTATIFKCKRPFGLSVVTLLEKLDRVNFSWPDIFFFTFRLCKTFFCHFATCRFFRAGIYFLGNWIVQIYQSRLCKNGVHILIETLKRQKNKGQTFEFQRNCATDLMKYSSGNSKVPFQRLLRALLLSISSP